MPAKGCHQWSQPAVVFRPMSYMEEFLEEKAGNLVREDYIKELRRGLAYFSDFCAEEDVRAPEEITRLTIVRFKAWVNGQERWKKTYRLQQLKYVRVWINWLVDTHRLPVTPWVEIRVGSIPKKPKPLEPTELAMLFAAHSRQMLALEPFAWHRRDVILVLLCAWGLRLHELAALNVANVDVRLNSVTVINKGGGTKEEPYDDTLKGVVVRYLQVRARYAKVGEDALLINDRGDRLSIDRIYQIFKALADKAGVDVNPHRMRDTFATLMFEGGVSPEVIQQLMGHLNREQTMSYTKINNPVLAAAHQKAITPVLHSLAPHTAPPATVSPPDAAGAG
jgi:site-specific recombinase XerD